MRPSAVPLFAAATVLIGVASWGGVAQAQTAPRPPAASPSPVPTEKPPAAFSLKIETYTSGTNQQFVGPGTVPAEGPAFAAGGALAPGTPYDFFSGRPQVTGQGISQDFLLTPTFAFTSNIDISATIGYGSASGTGNVVNYWGDAIMPSINTNLGSRAYTIVPAFPTHNGQDPISATKLGFLSGAITDHKGNGGLSVGWFNLHQNLPWALSQAPWVSTPFQLAPQLPQGLGDGPPSVDVLKTPPQLFPLSGADLWYKVDLATFELTSANLPAASNAPARILSGSLVIDHGDGLKYSGQLSGVRTSGPEIGRVLFGSNTTVVNGVPQSTVFGQNMLVLGLGVTIPLGTYDGEVRYGNSCYSAVGTATATAKCTSGNYYDAKLHHGFSHFDVVVEGTRNEATYAPAILDYGTIQNVWTYPAAWPNSWLRGNYQAVDTAQVGANRQGGKITTTFIIAGVEVRLAFGQYQQIAPLNIGNALIPGFVDPYFLPQFSAAGTSGTEQHFSGWFSYHAKWADITLDLSDVRAWRSAPAGQPQDNVSMDYPSGVLTLSRPFGPKVSGAAGVGRFALNGQFDTSGVNNASLAQDVVFAGLQLRSNSTSGYGLEYRLYSTSGLPTVPGAPSPAYHGPQILFYQRFKT